MKPQFEEPLFHPPSTTRLPAIDPRAIRLKSLCDPSLLNGVYQPIFRASSGELEGCEALLRLPADAGFSDAAEAFTLAARFDLLLVLERAVILRHLMNAEPRVSRGHRIFLNVSAPLFSDTSLGADWLASQVKAAGLSPAQVVLELTEILRIRDFGRFHHFLEPFRRQGFQIAIDDFGAGYTNLRMITDLSPDFVKMDRVFVDGISSHARKRILVESVVTLCHRVNCGVIAEGIELPEDLETCLAAGCDYLQGFLFGKPEPAEAAFATPGLPIHRRPVMDGHEDLRRLLVVETPLGAEESVAAAIDRFRGNSRLVFLPIIRGGRSVGLLKQDDLLDFTGDTLAGTVGDILVDGSYDRIDEWARPEEAAALVRRRPERRRFEPVVVVGPNQLYRGLLPVDILLSELARLNVEHALQTNSVTRLPGRLIFERTVSERLERKIPFAVARLNLRRFKLFNDRYGFLRGDDLLVFVTHLLKNNLGTNPETFAAHFSDDHFAFLIPAEGAEDIAKGLVTSFDEGVAALHDAEDREKGSFVVKDRRGDERHIALVGVSIGMVLWHGEEVNARTVLETAESTLNGTRRTESSSYLLNRRALPSATRLTVPA